MGKLYNFDNRGYEVASRQAGNAGGRAVLAAGQAWGNAFTEKETTFVKITSVTNGEVAVDGKLYHGVIFQGKLHLIEQKKVTAPFTREKFCKLMGFAEPSEPAPSSSGDSGETGPSEEELAALEEARKKREADVAALNNLEIWNTYDKWRKQQLKVSLAGQLLRSKIAKWADLVSAILDKNVALIHQLFTEILHSGVPEVWRLFILHGHHLWNDRMNSGLLLIQYAAMTMDPNTIYTVLGQCYMLWSARRAIRDHSNPPLRKAVEDEEQALQILKLNTYSLWIWLGSNVGKGIGLHLHPASALLGEQSKWMIGNSVGGISESGLMYNSQKTMEDASFPAHAELLLGVPHLFPVILDEIFMHSGVVPWDRIIENLFLAFRPDDPRRATVILKAIQSGYVAFFHSLGILTTGSPLSPARLSLNGLKLDKSQYFQALSSLKTRTHIDFIASKLRSVVPYSEVEEWIKNRTDIVPGSFQGITRPTYYRAQHGLYGFTVAQFDDVIKALLENKPESYIIHLQKIHSWHEHSLVLQKSSAGWLCDGRLQNGGCMSNFDDQKTPTAETERWRCDGCDFDLCGVCFHLDPKDPAPGPVGEASPLPEPTSLTGYGPNGELVRMPGETSLDLSTRKFRADMEARKIANEAKFKERKAAREAAAANGKAPAVSSAPQATSPSVAASPAPVAPTATAPAPGARYVAPQGHIVCKGFKLTFKRATLATPADSNGLADPYVKLKHGNAKVFKSHVIKKTLTPAWNESVRMEKVPAENGVVKLVVEIWDKDMLTNEIMNRADLLIYVQANGEVLPSTEFQVTLKNTVGKDDGVLVCSVESI